jgi:hypothetical protein
MRTEGHRKWQMLGSGKGLQRDVIYLGWPIAPSYMSPMRGEGGMMGLSQWVQLHKWSPKKLWRSNSIFNIWVVVPYRLDRYLFAVWTNMKFSCKKHVSVSAQYCRINRRKLLQYLMRNELFGALPLFKFLFYGDRYVKEMYSRMKELYSCVNRNVDQICSVNNKHSDSRIFYY